MTDIPASARIARLRAIDGRAELERDAHYSLAGLPHEAKVAELANPGKVVHVAIVTDFDGAPCVIGADYTTVKVGPYRFTRDRMPELWAAIGEAAWLAGICEEHDRQDDERSED